MSIARRDKGVPRWTPRDLWLLRWIAAQYVVRFDHLQTLLSTRPMGETQEEGWVAEATVRHWIERWRKGGILSHATILAGKPGWVWVTRKGLQILELPYRPWTPNPARLRHLFYINAERILCEDRDDQPTWVSERQLNSERGPRKRGERVGHLPDGELHFSDGDVIAIEVELTPKLRPRLADILFELGIRYSAVWYSVPVRMKPHLEEAIAHLPPYFGEDLRGRFDVAELEETW